MVCYIWFQMCKSKIYAGLNGVIITTFFLRVGFKILIILADVAIQNVQMKEVIWAMEVNIKRVSRGV